MRKALIIALMLAGSSTARSAEIGSLRLEEYRRTPHAYFGYLSGVREGIYSVLAMMNEGDRPICPPGKLGLTVEQADDILMRYAESHKVESDIPVSIILFAGLQETFPCPPRK